MSETNEFQEKTEDLLDLNKMLSETGTNKKTQKQSMIEAKLHQLINAQESFLNNQIKRLNEKAFVEFNSNIFHECRKKCIKSYDELDKSEKTCLKNCMSKYYRGVKKLRKIEKEIMVDFGPDIYVQEENSKKSLISMFELIEKRRSESLQNNLKI